MDSLRRMWDSFTESLTTIVLFLLVIALILILTSCLWSPAVALLVWAFKK